MSNQTHSFKPTLSLVDATMIVAGSMIGSGIFIVSAEVARSMGSSGWMMAMWVLAGVVTLIAALSYGELSGMFPKAGGQYVYLREAYNPFIAFLFGWTQFGVIQTGTIAAVAMAFAKYRGTLRQRWGNPDFTKDPTGKRRLFYQYGADHRHSLYRAANLDQYKRR